MKNLIDCSKRHIVLFQIIFSLALSFLIVVVMTLFSIASRNPVDLIEVPILLFYVGVMAATIVWPILVTLINITYLVKRPNDKLAVKNEKVIMELTISIGALYSMLIMSFSDISWKDWNEQLYNNQLHTPIATNHVLIIIMFAVVGIIGFASLYNSNVNKTPPLRFVLSISCIYLGFIVSAIWFIQTIPMKLDRFFKAELFVGLYVINLWILAAKLIGQKVYDYDNIHSFNSESLSGLKGMISNAKKWPIVAFILMWPLMGIIISISILFGQSYDSIIRAWTDTSDWTLSQYVAPPNIEVGEHYLCTAATRGHSIIVKPTRLGLRGSNIIVVNRQLCVANSFEQLIEERTPFFHKKIRGFYDSYGLPIAKLMKSPYVSDFVYLMMKPLEWLFVIVLYVFDNNPERRIATQYLPNVDKENLTNYLNSYR